MVCFLALAMLCAQAHGVHLSTASKAPERSAFDAIHAELDGLRSDKADAEGSLSTLQATHDAQAAALAAAQSRLATANAEKARLEKERSMLRDRYDAQVTEENGAKVNLNSDAIDDNADEIAEAETDRDVKQADLDSTAGDIAAAKGNAQSAAAGIDTAVANYAALVATLNDHIKQYQSTINTESASQQARDAQHQTDLAAKNAEIDAANADPQRQQDLTVERDNMVTTYNTETKASASAVTDATTERDAVAALVADVNAKLAAMRGHNEAEVKSCVDRAISNNVKYFGELQKANGAPSGCVRYHKGTASDSNDDEAYFLTSCDENHYNCRQGGCNGCETL